MTKPEIWEAVDESEKDRFHALRGLAIRSFAGLEQTLCAIFSSVSDTHHAVAATIFFKITNFRARQGIIEKLLKRKHKDTYATFWKSLERNVENLSHARNNIVHWTVSFETDGRNKF